MSPAAAAIVIACALLFFGWRLWRGSLPPPPPPPARVPMVSLAGERDVCGAGRASIGERVRARGRFSSTSGGAPWSITVKSEAVCNARGAGLLFVKLASEEEARKAWNLHPEGRHGDTRQADPVAVEGTVTKIEEGRFVHMTDGLVIAP